MKVFPINNIKLSNKSNTQSMDCPSNSKINSMYSYQNLNILNKNYNEITFKALSKESLAYIQKIPLDERLASMFKKVLQGDLILVGKKIHRAKERMLECAGCLDGVIKRIFFIPDENFHSYLAFAKNREGIKEVINLNDFDIALTDIKTGRTEMLPPRENFIIEDGDIIGVQKTDLVIKPDSKIDLSSYRKNFAEAKKFEESVDPEIEKLNKKIISQLSKDIKTAPNKVTFKDVGGQDALIEELKKSVIYPLKYPEAYSSFDINRGFILYGPPGTGKTHIARALANEADVNFMSLNGLEMESKWVGESEENWRNLFEEAKQKQPTIMFIDEFDAVAKGRGGKDVYGDKVLNQILTLMTDLDNNGENVFVIAATNNFKALDSAIIRSGRFSKHLEVKMPDLDGTRKILDIHVAKKPLDRNLDKDALAKKLYDLKTSGADIKYIVNEAHAKGYERTGIFDKMENGSLTGKDLRGFWITQEDFDKAIANFVETRNGTERRAIGFNK